MSILWHTPSLLWGATAASRLCAAARSGDNARKSRKTTRRSLRQSVDLPWNLAARWFHRTTLEAHLADDSQSGSLSHLSVLSRFSRIFALEFALSSRFRQSRWPKCSSVRVASTISERPSVRPRRRSQRSHPVVDVDSDDRCGDDATFDASSNMPQFDGDDGQWQWRRVTRRACEEEEEDVYAAEVHDSSSSNAPPRILRHAAGDFIFPEEREISPSVGEEKSSFINALSLLANSLSDRRDEKSVAARFRGSHLSLSSHRRHAVDFSRQAIFSQARSARFVCTYERRTRALMRRQTRRRPLEDVPHLFSTLPEACLSASGLVDPP